MSGPGCIAPRHRKLNHVTQGGPTTCGWVLAAQDAFPSIRNTPPTLDPSSIIAAFPSRSRLLHRAEPPPETLASHISHISPADDRLSVFASGRDVILVRRHPEVWAEAAARIRARAPAWHAQNAADAEAAGNWFAARSHLRRLSQLKPDNESVQARLKKAEAAFSEEPH